MLKLISDHGRWAVRDKSMIFSNVIWVSSNDVKEGRYILLDDNGNNLNVNIADYAMEA